MVADSVAWTSLVRPTVGAGWCWVLTADRCARRPPGYRPHTFRASFSLQRLNGGRMASARVTTAAAPVARHHHHNTARLRLTSQFAQTFSLRATDHNFIYTLHPFYKLRTETTNRVSDAFVSFRNPR